jgi:hypothetical protein
MTVAICPCHHLSWGAEGMAWSIYVAGNARVLMGADFGTLLGATLSGNPSWPFAAWAVGTGIAAVLLIAGWRASQTHVDTLDPLGLLWVCSVAFGCAFAIAHEWHLPAADWGLWMAVASRGVFFAGIAYGAAGIWLQVRGLVGATRKFERRDHFRPNPQRSARENTAQAQEIAALKGYKADAGELADFLRDPTVRRTLQKGLHSDGKCLAEAEQRKLDALFARMGDLYERLVETRR